MYSYYVSSQSKILKIHTKQKKRILLEEEMALLTTPEVCQPQPCICSVMFSRCLVWTISL